MPKKEKEKEQEEEADPVVGCGCCFLLAVGGIVGGILALKLIVMVGKWILF